MRFVPNSIPFRFASGLVVATSLVTIAFSFFSIKYNSRIAETELNKHSETLIKLSSENLSLPLWQYDYDYINTYLDSLFFDENVRMTIVREGDKVISQKRHKSLDQSNFDFFVNSPSHIVITNDIEKNDATLGSITIVFSRERIDRLGKATSTFANALLLVIIFTVSICSYLIFRKYLLKPISSLEKSAKTISSGNLDAEIDVVRNDEIGQLASSLREMMKTIKTITASRDELNKEIAVRKEIEKEKEGFLAELQKKNEEMERFVYTVSHDLKSPLVTISGFAGILRSEIASGNQEDLENNIDVIQNAAKRMQQLLNELLDISRAGVKVNPTETVNLEALVQSSIENVMGTIQDHNTSIEVEQELPDVVVDKQYALQVFENLIANASRYSRSAEGGSKVKIGVIKDTEELTCYVKDNGIGIESNHLEKVFDLFETFDQTSDGTGVGLAIVKRIIEAHGGRIWAESEGLGHGTTFFFTLPEA